MTAPPVDHDQILDEWKNRHDRIQDEVLALHHHRALWREMRDAILREAGALSGAFLEHYTALYVEAQTIRVRRLIRRGKNDPRSLGSLIDAVHRNSDVLTRSRYIQRATQGSYEGRRSVFQDWDRKRAGGEWTRLAGDCEQVTTEKVQSYLAQLDRCEAVARHADQRVAHIPNPSATGHAVSATFDDRDHACDEIAEVHRAWGVLLGLGYLAEFEPTIQGDWKAPFRRPLFEPRATHRDRQSE